MLRRHDYNRQRNAHVDAGKCGAIWQANAISDDVLTVDVHQVITLHAQHAARAAMERSKSFVELGVYPLTEAERLVRKVYHDLVEDEYLGSPAIQARIRPLDQLWVSCQLPALPFLAYTPRTKDVGTTRPRTKQAKPTTTVMKGTEGGEQTQTRTQ
ncbi:uncharacterized protein ColSpa_08493 [Colletotrichum spaethianum]|uniref:Uncharacterized protein n=1 Tax=Colletotrichum spaethianum TaxID=700344 RepID=A0AA37P9V4_9PEZI|nr:uncharacterized protein ColSpa_08493 [Colletotrichum spaethianum]GKT48312.1 hypothetical protein ColSpa_08493 [Colletotrichum spaethianum]